MLQLFIPAITQLLDKLIPDPAAKAQAQLEVLRMQQTGELANLSAMKDLALAQIGVNQQDAAGAPMQRNWRPFIGWVCGLALAWDTIGKPVFITVMSTTGHPVPPLPDLSSEQLYGLLAGMLGLGGLRTFEKKAGVA